MKIHKKIKIGIGLPKIGTFSTRTSKSEFEAEILGL